MGRRESESVSNDVKMRGGEEKTKKREGEENHLKWKQTGIGWQPKTTGVHGNGNQIFIWLLMHAFGCKGQWGTSRQ